MFFLHFRVFSLTDGKQKTCEFLYNNKSQGIIWKDIISEFDIILFGAGTFKIAEIPIHTKKTRKSRLFKGPLDYAIKAWLNIFRIYRDYDPLKFFGSVGLFFFSIGFALGVYFVYLHFTTGIVGHTALLILMIFLLLLGIQIISFGFLADMWKKS